MTGINKHILCWHTVCYRVKSCYCWIVHDKLRFITFLELFLRHYARLNFCIFLAHSTYQFTKGFRSIFDWCQSITWLWLHPCYFVHGLNIMTCISAKVAQYLATRLCWQYFVLLIFLSFVWSTAKYVAWQYVHQNSSNLPRNQAW